MRVLFDHQVFSYQEKGGVSRYFSELIQGLRQRGEEAATGWRWTPNSYLPGSDLLPRSSFRGKAYLRSLGNRWTSLKALRTEFDLFHPTYYDPYFLRELGDRPFVLTVHDMTHERFPEGLPDAKVVPERKRLLVDRAAAVIAVSEHTKADLIALTGVVPEKVVVIPHGNRLRPGLVIPDMPIEHRPFWLYVGARNAYKDFSVAVEGLGMRLRSHPGEFLIIAGGGGLTSEEVRRLDRAGLSVRWAHLSPTDAQLAGLYLTSLGLVYTSRYEGFGLPLLEAMAWGCPVVSSRSSSLPEVGGEAALYFEAGNATDLSRTMDRLDDPVVLSQCMERGKLREAKFSWSSTVEQTVDLYHKILQPPKRPDA